MFNPGEIPVLYLIQSAHHMKLMEAEFDYADKSKNGQLDPSELKSIMNRMNHPYTIAARVGK